jgi:NADH-quinone oxidoreductase subunit J
VIQAVAFYVFAAVTVASAFMVIASRNPVHSVLFLILAFMNGAALFVLLGAEFLAMIVLIVYIGAVAVLFLFVVMMLDIDLVRIRQGFLQYLPVGAVVGIILLIELLLVLGSWAIAPEAHTAAAAPMPSLDQVTNTAALGQLIYTKYVYFFEASGIVLLIAMIGAIVLTLQRKRGVKRQDVFKQTSRRRSEATELVKVKSGEGIS